MNIAQTHRSAYKRQWAAKHRDRVRRCQRAYRQRLARGFAGRTDIVTCRVCGAKGPRGELTYPSTGLICRECFKRRVKARAARLPPERVKAIHRMSYERRRARDPERFREYVRLWRARQRRKGAAA